MDQGRFGDQTRSQKDGVLAWLFVVVAATNHKFFALQLNSGQLGPGRIDERQSSFEFYGRLKQPDQKGQILKMAVTQLKVQYRWQLLL